MKCPRCGTDNEAGFRFCVKCGVNLEDPQDINIEQVDMGGYHSEEDPASGGYTFGSGTFTISDTPSRESSSDLYTADELNDSDEEFDFSSFDEPFIPKLDTGRVTLPEQSRAVRQAQLNNQGMMRPQNNMHTASRQGMMNGMPPQGGMQGLPQQNGSQQMNGMPMYGQPMMYGQPQAPDTHEGAPMGQMAGMQAAPLKPLKPIPPPPPAEDKEKVEVPDDFWEFFDGGKATEHAEVDSADDFFGKRGDEIEGMKRFEKKKDAYMNDTPLVDASKLRKNEPAKFNKFYMKAAGIADPDQLEAKKQEKHIDYMSATKDVDASKLRAHEKSKAWNIMNKADKANADELEANVTEHTEALMAQADHAVQAMPKKPKTYNDEIDAIELPESMKAKKTKKQVEIPGLPEI